MWGVTGKRFAYNAAWSLAGAGAGKGPSALFSKVGAGPKVARFGRHGAVRAGNRGRVLWNAMRGIRGERRLVYTYGRKSTLWAQAQVGAW